MQSDLDTRLIRDYGETEYCVSHIKSFVLKVGMPSSELNELYQSRQIASAAYITACNPYSCAISEKENIQRQGDLAGELGRRGFEYLKGIGQHPSGNWPSEPSFLILGLTLEAAKSLGWHYEQNAIIWCGEDAVPELVLLR